MDDNGKKPVSVRQLSDENYQTFDTVANLDRVTEVPYPLRKVQGEHKQKLGVSVHRNALE